MSLVFEDIHHQYGDEAALQGVSLTAQPGEVTSLLGPSGCGKTTLLNLAAGILAVQQGEISLEGELLASRSINPPPEERPVGLVFQEGALFPHMTVGQNIAFGIENHPDRKRIVAELLAQTGLQGFEGRYPHTLSGGQQQRVALARALAPEPNVLLFDEPFANIDIILRRHLRETTRRILKERNCIAVLVTHDPDEAMEVSDHIVVMDRGQIVQAGSAEDLFEAPASLNAGLLTGAGQLVQADLTAAGVKTPFGVFSRDTLKNQDPATGAAALLIRPGVIDLQGAESGPVVTDVRRKGLTQIVSLAAETGEYLLLTMDKQSIWTIGQHVKLVPQRNSILHFLPSI